MARKSTQQRRANPQMERLGSKGVFSYHSTQRSGGETTTRRFDQFREAPARRRFRFNWHQLPIILASCAIIVCLIYIGTLSGKPRVVVMGDQQRSLLRDRSVYEQAATEALGSSWLNGSKITVNTKQVSIDLRRRFPELSVAVVTIPLMDRRPVVEVAGAQPALSLRANNSAFLLDETGRALVSDKDIPDVGSWKVPQVIDESSAKAKVGQGILPEQTVTFITTFVAQLQAKGLKVTELRLPSQASELQVKIDGSNYVIKTSTRSDPRQAAGTFLALKDKLAQLHTTPKEYVDVRVEEKAYYK